MQDTSTSVDKEVKSLFYFGLLDVQKNPYQRNRMENVLKIVFTGGGSGGPTTPLLATYEELIHQLGGDNIEGVFWGTSKGPEKEMVDKTGIPFHSIPYGKLRRYWSWKNLIDPFLVILGFIVGFIKLIQFRPNVVVSAGSFVSVPVAYAAWLLRIPHIILQMDVKPGLANRLMAPVSSFLAYYFEQTSSSFPRIPKQKVGPIVRPEIQEAFPEKANIQFALKPDKQVLLITGGGQGSLGLNKAVEQVLDFWLDTFQVVHLTGKNNHGVECSHPDYHPFPFINEGMGNLLSRSDLVITRAGLGILGELAYLAKDTVLVPLPGGHQEMNASTVVKSGAAVELSQEKFLEEGVDWWKSFLSEYHHGDLGKKLQIFLPQGGTTNFVKAIRKVCS